MKLYFANTSPYARKARIVLHELGLQDRVQQTLQNPFEDSPDLAAANPLKKVPCLITPSGKAVYDSPVICAYLDSLTTSPQLIPANENKWKILTGEALSDGILDAAFAIVMERRRPEGQKSDYWLGRWQAGMLRAIDAAEADIGIFTGTVSMAQIALGAALGYLDFRLPDIDWRSGHTEIAHWFTDFSARPSMCATEPPKG